MVIVLLLRELHAYHATCARACAKLRDVRAAVRQQPLPATPKSR